MATSRGLVGGLLGHLVGRLRFPQLFLLTGGLFLLDLLIPDLIPLADELALGLVTLLLGSWRKERDGRARLDDKPPMKDITPRGDPTARE